MFEHPFKGRVWDIKLFSTKCFFRPSKNSISGNTLIGRVFLYERIKNQKFENFKRRCIWTAKKSFLASEQLFTLQESIIKSCFQGMFKKRRKMKQLEMPKAVMC